MPTYGQIYTLDFEAAGGYTTNFAESTDGTQDYFTRTDGSNINATYNTPQGSFYFAAQDIDNAPTAVTLPGMLDITGINIATQTNLSFSVMLAEDDDGGNQDWDDSDYVHFLYQIDGGGYQNLLWIENDGATFNTAPQIDTDFDGDGDGAEITDVFTAFVAAIAGTGNTLDIRVEISLGAGDEDIAFDNIQIFAGAPTTPDVALASASPVTAANVPVGTADHPVFQFDLAVTTATATLDQLDFYLDGSYVVADLDANPFALFYNTTNDFLTATQLGVDVATAGSGGGGEIISFTGLGQAIAAGNTGYFWVTADIAAAANVGNTIEGLSVTGAELSFTGAVNLTGTTVNAGVQTIAAPSASTVGFDAASATAAEGAGAVTVDVTMDVAPVADVDVLIADAGTGTATNDPADDFSYTNTTLTFTPAEVYPNTKSVTITVNDDALSEHNETIDLSLSITSGASSLGTTEFVQIITDNEALEGLIVNEISQGSSGGREFIELLVVGTPGDVVDLRGWVFDDNNGIFTSGAASGQGIAAGHVAFEDNCTWENVPVGSIIVFYNADDPNLDLPADDPTDADGDYTYVIPITVGFGSCLTPDANNYFEANAASPNTGDPSYGATSDDPCWSLISFRNDGDAAQIRRPATATSEASFFHGLSYGTSTTSDLIADNHPEATELTTEALYFAASGGNTVYYFDNTTNDNFRLLSNWASGAADVNQTPGAPNSANNDTYIQSLRQLLPVASTNSTYTCELREFESRTYLNASDEIFVKVINQANIDHGQTSAEVTYDPNGDVNLNLTDKPYFYRAEYEIIPTNSAGTADYSAIFYLSAAEALSLATEYNTEIQGTPGYTLLTVNDVLAGIRIYKSSSVDPLAATANGQVEFVAGTVAPYGATGDFQVTTNMNFTSFSQFRIGVVTAQNQFLPVELIGFDGQRFGNAIQLDWSTASELNSDFFIVSRSEDGSRFEEIGQMEAAGYSDKTLSYQFLDESPATGLNYYQLQQVDLDGTMYNLGTVAVLMGLGDQLGLQRVFPNPTTGMVTFQFELPADLNATLNLYTPQGQLVSQQLRAGQAGVNVWEVSVEDLSAGFYLYELKANGQSVRGKLQKQ